MTHNVTLIKGDGIGPEVSDSAVQCINATGVSINWEEIEAGGTTIKNFNNPLPDSVFDSISKNKVAFKGPIITPAEYALKSVNLALRKELDLFACVRPCKYYKGIKTAISNPGLFDIVIIRENTEDLYAGIEFEVDCDETAEIINFINERFERKIRLDSGISIKPISVFGSKRIAEFAYNYATTNCRKKVTTVTKSKIMKHTDGLFMQVAEKIGSNFPQIKSEHIFVDTLCMQLLFEPENFEILCLPNLYGDIISDLCAGMIGGLGVAPGAHIGEECAVFEPTHSAAPELKNTNSANPTAMILSGVMLLKHLKEFDAAEILEDSLSAVLEESNYSTISFTTNSLTINTKKMTNAVINKIKESPRYS